MKRLDWKNLFSEERERPPKAKMAEGTTVVRNAFEADYDRIVGSSSVRRLQDKAQVFPLQKDDVVRTRLTHSIEVSALARSLGKAVGTKLEETGEFSREDTEKLSALLQTTGLIHDLGNPPFGHYGERIIQVWTERKAQELGLADEQELQDFLCFDGNVQNLRIVTKLQTMNDAYGANFTYATLATLMKYPYSSNNRPNNKKKFGYFKSEEHIVRKVREKTGLVEGVRHPATYLLEAADDIIFLCDDVEDGVKKGYVNWDTEYSNIFEKFSNRDAYEKVFQKIEGNIPDPDMDKTEQILAKAHVFRNNIQSFLFKKAVNEFMENYESIMCGEYQGDLLKTKEDEFIGALKKVTSDNCFSCREVLLLEIGGYNVVKELLDIFYDCIGKLEEANIDDTKEYEGKIYRMISGNYKYIMLHDYENNGKKNFDKLTAYDKLHLIVDFVSGMTDSYAVSLHKKLTGNSLTE